MGREPAKTFNDAIERWTREDLPRLSPRSRTEAVQNAKHIAPHLEGKYLKDAAAVAVAIRDAWPELSPFTVNRRLAVLSRLCQLAYREWRWLDHPPIIKGLRTKLHENYLTPEQVETIASGCPRAGPLVLLGAYTGIRIGHLLRLTAADVVDGQFLRLDSSGKTGKQQLVPLHKRVRGLASLLPVQGMTYAVYYAEFRAACRKNKIRARPHDLRHTCASWMLHAGADSIHVRDMLGHSSVSVTQRYIHNKAAHLAEVVGRIGSTPAAHGQKKTKPKTRRARTEKPRKSRAL
jgi:integrase